MIWSTLSRCTSRVLGAGMRCRASSLGEVDLVVALQDGVRVVDHHQSFGGGAPREAVGVVVDEGGVADEQRVELGQPADSPPG